MKFMKYSLICTDIDGTLLDQNKVLLPQVKEALKKEADKGRLHWFPGGCLQE